MKNLSLLFTIAVFCGCHLKNTHSYSIYFENGNKHLKGFINKSILENDTTFAWFVQNIKTVQVSDSAVNVFKKNSDKFTLLIFGGTWCHDTKNLLPRLFSLINKSNYPENKIVLVMVNRKKKSIDNLPQLYKIKKTPTFIVLHNNQEVGRVIENGKHDGKIEEDLAEIITKIE